MPDDLVSKDNLSLALVSDVFESAYFDVDEKPGDMISVSQNGRTALVNVDKDGKRYICFRIGDGLKPGKTHAQRLEYINKVNESLITVRAEVTEEDDFNVFMFDYYLWVEGGVTRKNIVLAYKAFMNAFDAAINLDTEDVLA